MIRGGSSSTSDADCVSGREAQSTCPFGWTAAAEKKKQKLLYFMSVDRARFRRPVVPGDQVRYEVEIVRRRAQHCKLAGRAIVDGQVAAEAVCTSAMMQR